jgi:hypothetical protein
MKKKLNFLILNIFLTATISFFLSGGGFEEPKRKISPSKGGMGTLKLSGKNFARFVEGNVAMLSYPLSKQIVDSSGKKP